jgi:hypothetical protein
MAEPVKVTFLWSVDDVLTARRWHWRHICRPSYRRAVYMFPAFIAGLSIYSLIVAGPSWHAISFLVILFYLYVGRRYEQRWLLRRKFKNHPDNHAEVEWLISPDKVRFNNPQSQSESLWTAFAEIVQTRDGFLFCRTGKIFHFLPRRGFQSDSDFQYLSQLAKVHCKKFTQLV